MKTVDFLLSRGSSIHDRDLSDQTPLHHACDWNYPDIVDQLLKKGADVNTADAQGLSAFLVAAGWGREITLDLIMSKRLAMSVTDVQGNNVFHISAACGHSSVIKMIISKYPAESFKLLISRNMFGWTPLDFSIRCGHYKTTTVLTKAILSNSLSNKESKNFTHIRFNIVDNSELDFSERYMSRFVDPDSDMAIFRIPRCKWYIQSPGKDEYELVRKYVHKHDKTLSSLNAKT